MKKVYVRVLAEFDENGMILPRSIRWEDGRRFTVDEVADVRPAASTKVGGSGMRYACRIAGKYVYLFRDRSRWFMEGK